jgi:outer membrane biosynthesis protein TonB
MVHARPAHPAGASLAAILSLGLALAPVSVQAAPTAAKAPTAPSSGPKSPESGAPVEAAPEGDEAKSPEGDAAVTPEPEADTPAEATPEEPGETAPEEPDEAASEEPDAEPEGDDAAADEDTETAGKTAGAPEGTVGPTAAPLRPMQTAAWWTMFGAFAVGTTAGVLAGLAERQEDRATRLSTLFDSETGAQPLYADRKDEYEQYLRRGEGYGKAALGVGIVAGVATIAAITLFAIDATRNRSDAAPKQRRRAALRVLGGGVEVRF